MRLRLALSILTLAFGIAAIGGAYAQDKPRIEKVLQLGHWAAVTSVAYSPDGKTALSGSLDKHSKALGFAHGPRVSASSRGIRKRSPRLPIRRTARSRCRGGIDHTARLWDSATGREIRKIEGHLREVELVAFSPDGKTALSARGSDYTVRLWDSATGREIPEARGALGPGHFGCLFAGRQDRAVGE